MTVGLWEAGAPRVCLGALSVVDPWLASGFIAKQSFGKGASFKN